MSAARGVDVSRVSGPSLLALANAWESAWTEDSSKAVKIRTAENLLAISTDDATCIIGDIQEGYRNVFMAVRAHIADGLLSYDAGKAIEQAAHEAKSVLFAVVFARLSSQWYGVQGWPALNKTQAAELLMNNTHGVAYTILLGGVQQLAT